MKKECISWYCTINIDVLHTCIIVLVGNDKDDLEATAPDIDKALDTANLIQEAVKEIIEDYLRSCTLKAPNEAQDVIVFFNAEAPDKVSYEVMVHEFHHASNMLCESRGIEDEETEAYLQEHLFHKMLCKIDDYIDTQKKSKRKHKKNT